MSLKRLSILMLLCCSLAYAAPGDKTVIGTTSNLVPKTTQVNGHALTGNITLDSADVGAKSLTAFNSYSTATQTKLNAKVNNTITVNSQPLTGNVSITTITGNAGTATALAANGTNCSAGEAALGVDASGNSEGCWTPAGAYTLPTATSSVLGGVKPDGTSILNTSGAISATAASVGALASGGTATDSDKLDGQHGSYYQIALGYTAMKTDYSNAGTAPTWNQNTSGTAAGLSGAPNITVGTIAATSVNFGDTALAYYKQSTWTPALTFGGGNTGLTYSSTKGRYTRIGNMVFFTAAIVLSNKGSSTGSCAISLPITAAGGDASYPDARIRAVTALTFTAPLYATVLSGTASLTLLDNNSGTQRQLTDSAFANNTEINITGAYAL